MFDLLTNSLHGAASRLLLVFILLVLSALPLHAQVTMEDTGGTVASKLDETPEKDEDEQGFIFETVRTDSPLQTLTTFLRVRDDLEQTLHAYRDGKTRALANRKELLLDQLIALLDLSLVSNASRREVGIDTVAYLLDILGRVELPNLDSVPDEQVLADDTASAQWRLPQTPIRITLISEGPREGEFLFNVRTVRVAPRFYRGIENLPLRSSLGIKSWSRAIPQITGPTIPAGVLGVIPDGLKQAWLDTPRWKVLAVLGLIIVSAFVLILLHRIINRGETNNRLGFLLRRAITPVAILLVVPLLDRFIEFEINVSGRFSTMVDVAETIFTYAAAAWLFWLVALVIFERIIVSLNLPEKGFDTHLWRIGARVLGVAGGVIIFGVGAQQLGLPLYSVVAGLGIGGLAVALAVRPTLENLIGGIILYLDQPVRVGDFCSFDDKTGTIETIGIRSTKLRALDRTLVTIPNAALADMQLINWAKCDQMLITTTIGLRYETDSDQLRYVLVKFREMFHAHPKIDRDTVRVRFAGYGASSLDIDLRVYALTREWNEFFAIREDVFLRMKDIVEESGTAFAFPSQTLYTSRDEGLDNERGEAAIKEVKSWRRTGKLPFPRLASDKIDQLEGTLDYPPRGSVEIGLSEEEMPEAAEPLSAEPAAEEADKLKRPSDAGASAS
ncbi:MAG: mechanosensitive ion channel family protein [Nitrospira sp.]|nr:mechanosensitive ion channel family protein [Nitrospira sp.]